MPGSSSRSTESTGHPTGALPLPSLPPRQVALECSPPSCPFLKQTFHLGRTPQRLPLPVQLGLPKRETQTEVATPCVSPPVSLSMVGAQQALDANGVGEDSPVFLGKSKVGPMARKESGETFQIFMAANLPHHRTS